ncbi:hypothetical protein NC651_017414 [Populus alba x Populus x berolinensis]|nr:hypothetical protein NC651_017414 [Populus alba x Populus x berolinensis]
MPSLFQGRMRTWDPTVSVTETNQKKQVLLMEEGYSSFHGLLRNHKPVARNKFNSYILMAYEL